MRDGLSMGRITVAAMGTWACARFNGYDAGNRRSVTRTAWAIMYLGLDENPADPGILRSLPGLRTTQQQPLRSLPLQD